MNYGISLTISPKYTKESSLDSVNNYITDLYEK